MPGRRQTVIPQAARPHRTVSAVDTPIPPVASNPDWRNSEGYPIVRFYVTTAFTGGTNPFVNCSVWVRQKDGVSDFVVARAPVPDDRFTTGLLKIDGNDKVAFDALVEGDDALFLVEEVSGSPSSFSVTIEASGR